MTVVLRYTKKQLRKRLIRQEINHLLRCGYTVVLAKARRAA